MKKSKDSDVKSRASRGFNQLKALENARDVSLRKGYEGTSLGNLTDTMQIHADPACEHLKTLLFCQAKTVPLKQGVTDKQLPEQTNIEALSQYVSGLMQGIAVMARQRSDRHLLNNITRV